MKSTKSSSASKRAVEKIAGRSRLFSRGVRIEKFTPADLKYLWAAYRLGGIDPSVLPPGMDKEAFDARAGAVLSIFDYQSAIIQGGKPVGLVVGREETSADAVRFWPHITWFPWATARNKLEGAVKLADFLRNYGLAVAIVKIGDKEFWTQVCRYGVMRRAGTIINYFGPGKPGAVFHTTEA